MTRQTKIVATLGPAVASLEAITELIEAGMNVARLNFSHGTHETHRQFVTWVRDAAASTGRIVAILQDIQGPKIRVGALPGGEMMLIDGETVALVGGDSAERPGEIPIDHPGILEGVLPGHAVLLADGQMRVEVVERNGGSLMARVINGGVLTDFKGAAFPDSELKVPSVTDKDREDLEFGRELGVDYVAASFVRTADDILLVKTLVEPGTPIIAKIELAAAVDNLGEILKVADGAMVARGDLGVQLPLERLPMVQKEILKRTNAAARISITATEMLESMTNSPRPTRAEVTDVANAVLAGTDAVMLSGETASGKFPVEAVEMMDTICREVEGSLADERGTVLGPELALEATFASVAARGAVDAATRLGIETIVAFTESGSTARLVSKFRPAARIIAYTPEAATARRMALYWGVTAAVGERQPYTDLMIADAERHLIEEEICVEGEAVVMVAGIPPNQRSSTNLMKLHLIGSSTEGTDSHGESVGGE